MCLMFGWEVAAIMVDGVDFFHFIRYIILYVLILHYMFLKVEFLSYMASSFPFILSCEFLTICINNLPRLWLKKVKPNMPEEPTREIAGLTGGSPPITREK
ncbi:hypothetical protein ACJX0J_035017, partial [Zea mays]